MNNMEELIASTDIYEDGIRNAVITFKRVCHNANGIWTYIVDDGETTSRYDNLISGLKSYNAIISATCVK